MSLTGLTSLDSTTLRALARVLAGYGDALPPTHRIDQLLPSSGTTVSGLLGTLIQEGWTVTQLAAAIDALATAKSGVTPVPGTELVLSGPSVSGIPTRDTSAVVQALFADAEEEVLVVGYAFYNGRQIFQALADRWRDRPALRVRFIVDIRRSANDTSLDDQIVGRFVTDFFKRQWPWSPRPELVYDPRALRTDGATRASVHAKCIIVDRRIALVTSANFTPAAQERNVEVGVLLRDVTHVVRLSNFFMGLQGGCLLSAPS